MWSIERIEKLKNKAFLCYPATIDVDLGGVSTKGVVDSGSCAMLMGDEEWKKWRSKNPDTKEFDGILPNFSGVGGKITATECVVTKVKIGESAKELPKHNKKMCRYLVMV
eukprot:GHVP01018972.1.p3 GENE.GHVP01018972.1~~GHVP01018972.1.p3  ORF type:complete len:110 (+),score=17.40 GHVP01018972.1:422-751(+)